MITTHVRTQARDNLMVWESQFRLAGLKIASASDCEREARNVIIWVRQLSTTSLQARRRIQGLINFIAEEAEHSWYAIEHLDVIILRLQKAADLENDFDCPWGHLREQFEHKTTLLAVADALWGFNNRLEKEWTIPLYGFAEKVWGTDEKNSQTIRSSVSKLCVFLKKWGVEVEAKVHDRRDLHRIDCKLL
jgi:hypothetical protein